MATSGTQPIHLENPDGLGCRRKSTSMQNTNEKRLITLPQNDNEDGEALYEGGLYQYQHYF